MIDCKSCGMTFDENDYQLCPYCGEEVEDKQTASAEKQAPEQEGGAPGPGGAALPVPGEPSQAALPEKSEPVLRQKPKPAPARKKSGPSLFVYLGAVLILAALGAGVYFFLLTPEQETSYTVPGLHETIQGAIDSAANGDVITVAPGLYHENIDFKGKEVILTSVDPDDPEVVAATIIDGSGRGAVISFRSGEGENAVLTGFTITRGSGVLISGGGSPLIIKNVIDDNDAELGGGMIISDSAPQIRENTFNRNSAAWGGAIFAERSAPVIEGNIITENRANFGGGILIIEGTGAVVTGNTFRGNLAAQDGGGILVAADSSPYIFDNIFDGNRAGRYGGGIYTDSSNPIVEGNRVSGNRAELGAGLFILHSSYRVDGNTFEDNEAGFNGGAIYVQGSSPVIENNVMLRNSAVSKGGGIAAFDSVLTVSRNTFEGNSAGDGEEDGGGAIFSAPDTELTLSDPDDNSYGANEPQDIYTPAN